MNKRVFMQSRPLKKSLLIGSMGMFALLAFLWPGTSAKAAPKQVYVASLSDETINPVTAEYIARAIERASEAGAELIILELDTPGGLLDSTRLIVKEILSAPIPVIVYIAPAGSRAGSAGVFITYSSHVAAMAPSTNIGAAHPVPLGGTKHERRTLQDSLRDLIDTVSGSDGKKDAPLKVPGDSSPLEDKILHDTVAFIKAMARERGRNELWAEKSVTESDSITAEDALQKGVIEIIAKDIWDLLKQLNGRSVLVGKNQMILQTENVDVERIPMDVRQKLLNILANPNLTYILMMLGFYGLLFEVTHPGFGVPGVLGTVFLIIALFSMQLLPVNYAGLGLMILGLILFAVEVIVPGFGLPALGGLLCLALGSLFLFDSQDEVMRVSISVIIAITLATAIVTIGLIRAVVMSHRKRSISGKDGLIESKGEARTDLKPGAEGKVFVHGEIWNAVTGEEIKKGEKVVVREIEGLILKVEKHK